MYASNRRVRFDSNVRIHDTVSRERPHLTRDVDPASVPRGRSRLAERQVFRLPIVAYTEDNSARFGMAKPVPLPPPGFDNLSVDDQIEYVQSLWDRIAATPEQVPVPEWHREILEERLKDDEANPNAGETWDVLRERLRDKLRQR